MTPARRSTLRPIGPAVAALVHTLHPADRELVEIRLSPRTAAAITRLDPRDAHSAHAAAVAPVVVDRMTAERWRVLAWRAVGEGLLAPADAQAVSDLLEPRGAA